MSGKFSPSVSPDKPPFETIIYPRCFNRSGVEVAKGDIVMFDMARTASVSATATDGTHLPAVTHWGRGIGGVFNTVVKAPATVNTFAPVGYGYYGVAMSGAASNAPLDVLVAGEVNVNVYAAASIDGADYPSGCVVDPVPDSFKAQVLGGNGAAAKRFGILKDPVTGLSSAAASSQSVAVFFNGIDAVV